MLSESRATLERTAMPIPAWFIPQIDFWSGDVMARKGNVVSGLALMEGTVEPLWAALTSPIDRFDLASFTGIALMDAGRHESAARWLGERMETRRLNGESRHPWATFDYIFVARNLMMSGRYDDALSTLDAVPLFEPVRGEVDPLNRRARFRTYRHRLQSDTIVTEAESRAEAVGGA